MNRIFPFLAAMVVATAALGAENVASVPEPDSSTGSAGGFSAKVMVTSDKDWQEKWGTPEEDVPHFTVADSVKLGDTVTVLTFFSNATPGPDGKIEVRCDLKMVKPGGVVGTDLKDVLCFPQVALPRPQNVQLTSLAVMFQAEASDPKGVWTAYVVVHDVAGNHAVPLKASFRVE